MSRLIGPVAHACVLSVGCKGDHRLSGTDIFLSYSSADRATARRFAEHFEHEGFTVWWDAALYSGQTFDEVIEAELRAARVVVVLWSPRSVTSRWVRAEATLADRHNKLVPALIEPCERPIIFELTHTVDLSRWTGDPDDPAWIGFLHDVRRALDRTDVAGGPVSKPPFGASPPVSADISRDLEDSAEILLAVPPVTGQVNTQTMLLQNAGRVRRFDSIADEFHCLEQMQGSRMEKRYVVGPEGLRIGRTPPAEIVISDQRVSRVHCLIELADDRLEVSDLNSTNGTYIDGKRIHGRAFLNLGSVIRVSDMTFIHTLRRRAEALQP